MKARNDLPPVNRVHSASALPRLLSTTAITLLWLLAVNVSAQDRTITGTVTTDEDGLALPGVNIIVKGTMRGTTTDAEGKYSINLSPESKTLIFSFVGFETHEEEVGERNVVDVKLEFALLELDEIVITALGLEKDRDKVGSASTHISGSHVAKSGEPTLINGMSGKSSGLIISRTAGDPGAGSYIQIRGQSSITASVQPLIVVDGIPVYNTSYISNAGPVEQSRLNDINAGDIESVEVLKGASASALWGTRAGNGVIMITTKKGKSKGNKVNISYAATYSIDKILVKHPLQNKWGQGTKGFYFTNVLGNGAGHPNSFGDKIANRPGGADSVISDPLNPVYRGYFLTSDGKKIYPVVESDFTTSVNGGKNSTAVYDPYDAIFDNGHFLDQSVSISGGNKDGNYYISLSDLNQDGIIKTNSNYRRTSVRLNMEKQFNDWLKASWNTMYAKVKSDRILQGNTTRGLPIAALRTPPDWNNAWGYEGQYFDAKDVATPNRQLAYRNQIGRNFDPVYDNPLWVMNNEQDREEDDRLIGSLQLDVTPIRWLTLSVRGGVDHYSQYYKNFSAVGSAGGFGGSLMIGIWRETQYNFDAFVRSQFKVGNAFRLSPLIGFNANQRTADNAGGAINSFVITTDPPLNLNNALAANKNPFNGFTKQRTAALYSTVDLEFKDQLFLGLTGRAENSSNFSHANNSTFLYPSATINWHVLKTLGLQNKAVSFVKVRAGYGVVSTIPGPYTTITYWNPSNISDGFGPSLNSSGYGSGGYEQSATTRNNSLKPETKTEIEGGLDLKFLQDRISLSATYFTNEIRDVILNVPVAGSTGFSNKTGNAGAMQNKGWEVDFSGDVLKVGDFTFNVYGNFTRIRNKVTDLAGAERVHLGGLSSASAVEGYPLSVFYGSIFERDDAGAYVLDAAGFPKISATVEVIGNPNPDWRAGLGFNLSWKGITVHTLFEHSHGGDIWGGTRGALINFGTHKDTDREVTVSAADAKIIKNYFGPTGTLVKDYGYMPNADSSFTVRGYLHDFGGGVVLLDEAWWTRLGGGFGGPGESFMESAQWTKLRELSVSYTLKSERFRKISKLNSVDFTVTGRNLFLWTDFKGNDPETNLNGPSNSRGQDYFNNPATKSFLFSIKINY